MIFLVYAQQNKKSIEHNLGVVDYSYYFLLQKFLPILKKFGAAIVVRDLGEVKALFAANIVSAKECIFFCCAPPHRAPLDLPCRVITYFAWEYSTIPNEAWGNDPRQNWVAVLQQLGSAMACSTSAVTAVRDALGQTFPVASLPAPVWDEYAHLYHSQSGINLGEWQLVLEKGIVLDSNAHGAARSHTAALPDLNPQPHVVTFSGVIYTTIFNPADGRKNWGDFIAAFCYAFRDEPGATLVMKLVCSDIKLACGVVWHEMKKLSPYRCRVVAIQGYLDDKAYADLVRNSAYVVNSSYGEGQCLPLTEFMSAGKPAIAPDHTAMADYVCAENAFVVRSSEEWTHWPHDPRLLFRAFRYRTDWESLRDAFIESYRVIIDRPEKYLRMSQAATDRLRAHCSRAVIENGFARFLSDLPGGNAVSLSIAQALLARGFITWGRLRQYAARKKAQFKQMR